MIVSQQRCDPICLATTRPTSSVITLREDGAPPDVRLAYEKALHDGAMKKKFVVNGQSFASEDAMPGDVRKLCEDVMGVIENNGEVTLPSDQQSGQLLTKRELGVAVAVGVGIAALVLARIFHG